MYICIQSTESDSLKLLLNLCVDKPDIQEKQTFDTKKMYKPEVRAELLHTGAHYFREQWTE